LAEFAVWPPRTALAAVEVLIEVFKRAGREVSREQLVAAL